LRIEALPPHGALALYILIARSGEITALIPPERRAARGASSTALFRRYLDLPFREAEIMAIIAGELEADALRGGGEVRCGVGECTFQRKDRRYSWRFDKVTGALSGVTLRDPLKLRERVRVTYDDYRPVGERFLPGFIRVELIEDGVVIELSAAMLSADQPINPRVFEVAIPADYSLEK
jgi:hypothetical protein